MKKGFTLIELLIVIALLGALAVGLIGALDPFEQLKKGTDTGRRDLVSQVQTAIIRYYSTKNLMPWTGSDPNKTDLATAPMAGAITAMVTAGELSSNFTTVQAGNLTKIWVTGTGLDPTAAPTAIVCYKPDSKSFQVDPNTKFNQDGSTATAGTCLSGGGTTACYWCIR